ncbi:MAG TPA: hypothetical protein VE913_03335 [Longimicrobium sp.]|nr:hypothetical protein [Longimicrobium sp.]
MPIAAVVARRLAWDSEFFRVPMARIEYVLGSDEGARRAAVGATLAELGARGVRHVAARVDVANVAGAALLEDCGFRLRDALMTYVSRPVKEPAREVRARGRVRPFREEDGPELVALAREAFRGFHSRFHADPGLPRDRADALYEEWARECVSGRMADTILVSEGERGLLGFLAWRRREPVSSVSGVPIFGGGLGACRPDAPGAFAGLVHTATRWAHERGGVAECQTLNHNFAAIRVYEEVGAHYVRGEYTMHVTLRSGGS